MTWKRLSPIRRKGTSDAAVLLRERRKRGIFTRPRRRGRTGGVGSLSGPSLERPAGTALRRFRTLTVVAAATCDPTADHSRLCRVGAADGGHERSAYSMSVSARI